MSRILTLGQCLKAGLRGLRKVLQELHDRRNGVLEIFLQIGLTEGHVLEHPALFFHFADEAIQGKQVLIDGLDFSLKPLIGLNEHGIALNGRLQFLELILDEPNQGHRTLSDLLIAVENQITDRGKGLDILIAQNDLAVNFLSSKKRARPNAWKELQKELDDEELERRQRMQKDAFDSSIEMQRQAWAMQQEHEAAEDRALRASSPYVTNVIVVVKVDLVLFITDEFETMWLVKRWLSRCLCCARTEAALAASHRCIQGRACNAF